MRTEITLSSPPTQSDGRSSFLFEIDSFMIGFCCLGRVLWKREEWGANGTRRNCHRSRSESELGNPHLHFGWIARDDYVT